MTDVTTLTERELLELAAEACGIEIKWENSQEYPERLTPFIGNLMNYDPWFPSRDDGHCARMEAELGIDVEWSEKHRDVTCSVSVLSHTCCYDGWGGKQAARRRASLLVAAQIALAKREADRS